MKKMNSIAFSVCAAASLLAGKQAQAQAESSLTLYGSIDTAMSYTNFKNQPNMADRASVTEMTSGNYYYSQFGMRGQENLGEGRSVKFQLESWYQADTGGQSGKLFDSRAWVGLADTSLGEIRFGRQKTASGEFFGDNIGTSNITHMGLGTVFKPTDDVRFDNAMQYYSPTWGGASFAAGYSHHVVGGNESAGSSNNTQGTNVAVKYQTGALTVVGTYDHRNLDKATRAGNNGKNSNSWQLVASYQFDSVKLSAGYARLNNQFSQEKARDFLGTNPLFADKDNAVNAYYVGFRASLSDNTSLMGQYAVAKATSDYSSVRPGASIKPSSATVANIGVVHSLSKRSGMYAIAGHVSNNTFGFGGGFSATNPDAKATRYMVGVYHAF